MGCTSDLYAAGLKPLLNPVHPVEMGSALGTCLDMGLYPPPMSAAAQTKSFMSVWCSGCQVFKSTTAIESCTTGMGPLAGWFGLALESRNYSLGFAGTVSSLESCVTIGISQDSTTSTGPHPMPALLHPGTWWELRSPHLPGPSWKENQPGSLGTASSAPLSLFIALISEH